MPYIDVFSAPFLLHHVVLHQPLIYFDLGTLGPLNIPKRFEKPHPDGKEPMLVKGPISWSWSGHLLQQRIKVASGNMDVLPLTTFHTKTGRFSVQPAQPTAQNNFDRSETLKMNLFKAMQTVGDLLLMHMPLVTMNFCDIHFLLWISWNAMFKHHQKRRNPQTAALFFPPSFPSSPTEPLLNWNATQGCTADITSSVGVGELLLWRICWPHVEGASVVAKHHYERPKRWVLQKNPCGLIKAAVPEGLIGHFQPHKPPQSCMKIDILNSLYETIWLKLSSILKEMLQFAHVVMDSDTPNAYHHMKLLCFHNFVGKPKNDGFLDILWPLSWMTLSSRI